MSPLLKILENEVQIAALLSIAMPWAVEPSGEKPVFYIRHYKLDMKVVQVLELVSRGIS